MGAVNIAEKRMFAKYIIDSDAFLEMPMSARLLYYDLNMRADDDGFVNSPKKIQRITGASDDDLKILFAKRFILAFESGIIVIKHWRIHNYIRRDTYKETLYIEEKSSLYVKPDGAYTDHPVEALPSVCDDPVTTPLQSCDETVTQIRLDKDREDNIGGKSSRFIPPTIEEVTAYCQERKNGVDPVIWWNFYDSKNWYVGKNKMVRWKSAIATWGKGENKPIEQPKPKAKQYKPVEVNGEIVMEVVAD